MASIKVPIEVDITLVNKVWFGKIRAGRINNYVICFYQRAIADLPPECILHVLEDKSITSIKEAFLMYVPLQSFLYAEQGILPEEISELYDINEFKINDVNKEVHVSNVKNAWKDLKRQLKTVHISVSKKHLQLYCNEVSWRINHRHLTNMERFNLMLKQICQVENGKTTYKNLIK